MIAVASRIERLKLLSRSEPERPAAEEFSLEEIEAVRLLKKRHRRRNEVELPAKPTIGELVLCIAELGGYTGKSSGGPPGSITIRRGLDTIAPLAAGLEQLKAEREM